MDDELVLENRWKGSYEPLEGKIYLVCKRYRVTIFTIYRLLQQKSIDSVKRGEQIAANGK